MVGPWTYFQLCKRAHTTGYVHVDVPDQQAHFALNTHMHTKHHSTYVCSHPPFPQQSLLFNPVFSVFSARRRKLGDCSSAVSGKRVTLGGHTTATEIHIVEHTKEYLDTLQPCALFSYGFGCIDVLTPSTVVKPKARNIGLHSWSDSAGDCGGKPLTFTGYHSQFTYHEFSNVRRLNDDNIGYICSFKRIATSDLGTCVSLCFCASAGVHVMWFVRLCLQALRRHSWHILFTVSSHQMFQQELRKPSLLSHRPSDESEHWLMRSHVFVRYGLQQQGAETVVAGAVLPS